MHFFLWGAGGGGGGSEEEGVYFGDVQMANAVFWKAERFRLLFSISLIIHKENTKEIDILPSYLIDRIGILDSGL